MKLEIFDVRPDDWDVLIQRYQSKTLFHETAWHNHLMDIHPRGRMVYGRLRDGNTTVGHYCGLRVRKMGIPVHGSPLGGTGTNFMGPLIDEHVDMTPVVDALGTGILRWGRSLHLELSNPMLDEELMKRAGYHVQPGVTHLCEVPAGEEDAWGYIRSTARNRVRKSRKQKVVLERTTDPAIVDRYYEQFGEVYGKQNMALPWGIERVRSLFDRLHGAGRLLALWAKHDERVIATGLFPYDDRCIYFWGGASWLKDQHLYPNEHLQWEVLRFAAEEEIPLYNMCGGMSQFKNKFGGEDVGYNTYYRSRWPILKRARNLYRRLHFARIRGR